MDELLKKLEFLSIDFVSNLSIQTFEQIEEFMEKREELFIKLDLDNACQLDKDKYKDIVNRILKMESTIISKMEGIGSLAKKELVKVNSGRIHKNAYETDHQMTDGIFFDKKK